MKTNFEETKAGQQNSNTIFSDDPEAIKKLKTKIEADEKRKEYMKKINAAWKSYTTKQDDSKLKALNFDDEKIQALKNQIDASYSWDKRPFASYTITNLNQNISRLKKRLAGLMRTLNDQTEEKEINGVKILENVEANRIQLFFPDKPSAEIRTQLKQNGFRWSPNAGAWQRHRSSIATRQAKTIVNSLNEN